MSSLNDLMDINHLDSENQNRSIGKVVDRNNGLFLSNIFIPQEVIANILLHLEWKELVTCRIVCHTWKQLIDLVVCFEKIKPKCLLHHKQIFSEPINLTPSSLPFDLCFLIQRGSFGTNMLKNAFGSDCPRFKHWNIGGGDWIVEAEPVGSDLLPEHLAERSCFVTSYQTSAKEQLITLSDFGLNNKIMDEVQPDIEVLEWFARRWDCGVKYKLEVRLLNGQKNVVHEFKTLREDLEDSQWHKVMYTFKDYGEGVRYVLFHHAGRDTQYWAGHYGCKMAGGSVVAKLPASYMNKATYESR